MTSHLQRLRLWFFAPMDATGFGVLRIVWAAVVWSFSLLEAPDVLRYYSDAGVMPPDILNAVSQTAGRFSIFSYIHSPAMILELYAVFLVTVFLMGIGKWTRVTTLISVLLFFSFSARNSLPGAGGETVLRLAGFILLLCPTIHGLSVDRLRPQWVHWRMQRTLLPPLKMPVWPWRLLVWQLVVIYGMSVWSKLLGAHWRSGEAVGLTMQSPNFVRLPNNLADVVALATVPLTYGTIVLELSWLLILVPRSVWDRLSTGLSGIFRRLLIVGSLIFHGGIFVTMLVGSFSPAMLTFLSGVTLKEDWLWLKKICNRRFRGPIAILYDGNCSLCLRSAFWLQMGDWLGRLRLVNFRQPEEKKSMAADLHLADLDRRMHIRFTAGKKRGLTLQGFAAFRALSLHLPALWPLIPFLYLPGISVIGHLVYDWIAANRPRCTDENCVRP